MWQWSQCFLAVSGLFLYTFFCHSMDIFFLKSAEYKASVFAAVFFFHFSSHDDLSMGSSQTSIIFCWFHPSSSRRRAKNAWKWKIDGCRMNFNYCSKAQTKSIKGGGMKKKRCWKIIIFVSAFYEKEIKFWDQKCPVGIKGHGVSPPFQRKIFFMADFSQQRDKDLQWWD